MVDSSGGGWPLRSEMANLYFFNSFLIQLFICNNIKVEKLLLEMLGKVSTLFNGRGWPSSRKVIKLMFFETIPYHVSYLDIIEK